MPNTGQLVGQCWKCDKCRKDFKNVWLPTNVCCRVSVLNSKPEATLFQTPYSRHLSGDVKEAANMTKSVYAACPESGNKSLHRRNPDNKQDIPVKSLAEPWMRQVNSMAPFSTLGKYTCGYYFSRDTDNKKRKTGIPPSNLVAWRSLNP